MSPQVANIFNGKSSKNTAFNIILQDVQATYAYDFINCIHLRVKSIGKDKM